MSLSRSLTRYAEENQLAYIKESKSSAIFDCVVVIPDMFDAALPSISLSEIHNRHFPISPNQIRFAPRKLTLQENQSPQAQNN